MAPPPGALPPPPGPPLAYPLSPPPPRGGVPPPYAPPPSAPPPGHTRRSLASIATGIRRYEVFLGLNVALTGVLAVAAWLTGARAPVGVTTSGGLETEPLLSFGTPLGAAVLTIAGLVEAVGLVVLLLAWTEWRSGIRSLQGLGTEYGPEHAREISLAHRDYGRAVAAFLLGVVASLVTGAALVVYAVVTELAAARSGIPVNAASGVPGAVWIFVATIALSGLFNALLLYFSGRSLSETIRALLAIGARARVEDGRRWMLVGAVISPFLSLVAVFVPLAAVVSVAGTLVVVYGLRRVGAGYEGFLSGSAAPIPG